MFNTMQFAVGFLLAENERKRLLEKGAEVPKNFVVSNSILFGAMGNSAAPAILLQNETHKKDKEVQEQVRQNLDVLLTKLDLNTGANSLMNLIDSSQLSTEIKDKYVVNANGVKTVHLPNLIDSLMNRDVFKNELGTLMHP